LARGEVEEQQQREMANGLFEEETRIEERRSEPRSKVSVD
jgi:hypothetical protein